MSYKVRSQGWRRGVSVTPRVGAKRVISAEGVERKNGRGVAFGTLRRVGGGGAVGGGGVVSWVSHGGNPKWRGASAMGLLLAAALVPGVTWARSSMWGARVTLAGSVWQFPSPITGLGYAGSNRLWVFLSARAILPPDEMLEVNTRAHKLLLTIRFPQASPAFGTSPDGAAFLAEGEQLHEWWDGQEKAFRLPEGITVTAVAPVSHGAVWIAFRLGLTRRMEAGLYRVPQELLVDSHHLAGMANEAVVAMAPSRGGLWVATGPRPVLYWVPASGGFSPYTKAYARAMTLPSARTLAGVGVNARGQGWVSGYTTGGQPSVWAIASPDRVGSSRPLPYVVNMVSQGLAVAPNGVGYVGFSAVGGSSGYPGVVGVTPQGSAEAAVWPQLAMPGGGVGPLLLTPQGQLWGGMPFSHLLLPLRAIS